MKVVSIPLDQIEIGQRLREIDRAYVEWLAASFKEDGQRTPIEVQPLGEDGKYKLVAGAHRTMGMKAAGFTKIHAVVKKVTQLQADLLEIDENLIRHDLTVLDRSIYLSARKGIYEQQHPETRQGGDRRSDQTDKSVVLVASFSEETAERLGLSPRSIERAVRRVNRIGSEVKKLIHATVLANKGSELDALAGIEDEDMQLRAAELVLEGGAPSIAEAQRALAGTVPPPVDVSHEQFQSFAGRWERTYSARAKELIRDHIMKVYGLVYADDQKH